MSSSVSRPPSAGTKSARFNAGQRTPNAVLTQSFQTAAGQPYTLGFDYGIYSPVAQREQQYLLDARAYAPNLATLSTSVSTDVTSYYTIQICQTTTPCAAPGGTPPTFAVIATPIAGTAQAGDYTLTLDHTGAKGPAGVW